MVLKQCLKCLQSMKWLTCVLHGSSEEMWSDFSSAAVVKRFDSCLILVSSSAGFRSLAASWGSSGVFEGDLRKFACDLCQRKFKTGAKLERHRRIHTGEKPYICVICQKSFTQSNSLHRHIRLIHKVPNVQEFCQTTQKDSY